MYIFINIKWLSILSLVFSSFAFAEEAAPEASSPATDDDIAYFFGYRFGNALLEGGNENVSLDVIMKGLKDSLGRQEPTLSEERQTLVIREIQARQINEMAETAKEFLTANSQQEGIKITDSGLQYLVLEAGEGESPQSDSNVVVHYEGRLINNQMFDSSLQRGEPARFNLSQVIPGWTEGLQLMKEGGKVRFFIPPELGYGPGGTQNIPPHSVLVFDVQLLEITANAPAASEAKE
jgi:FKBP-type peptidyl-prolyl cis-trans isomerase FklB